jgi:HK97 gp10 family phage protein
MIDMDRVYAGIKLAVQSAMDDVAERILTSAQKKAPVRKLFHGQSTHRRWKTSSEVATEAPMLKALGLPAQKAAPASTPYSRAAYRKTGYAATIKMRETARQHSLVPMRNKANAFLPQLKGGPAGDLRRTMRAGEGGALRLVTELPAPKWGQPRYAINTAAEARLTEAGKRELRSGRALSNTGGEPRTGGNLRDSIHVEDADEGSVIRRLILAGGSKAPYAKYVEFGTRRHGAAQPFMRPALKEAEFYFPQMLKTHLKQELGR